MARHVDSRGQSPALDPPRAEMVRVEATGVAPVGSGLDGPDLRLLPPLVRWPERVNAQAILRSWR